VTEGVRHSQAHEAEIISDPILRAQREAANALKQYGLVTEMVQTYVDPERPFVLDLRISSRFTVLLSSDCLDMRGSGGHRASQLAQASINRPMHSRSRNESKTFATM
jgi:hypothetical protein